MGLDAELLPEADRRTKGESLRVYNLPWYVATSMLLYVILRLWSKARHSILSLFVVGEALYFPAHWFHATLNLEPYTVFVSAFT